MAKKTIEMRRDKKEIFSEENIPKLPHYSLGGLFGGASSDLTNQNKYQAQLAPTAQSNYGGTIDQASQNALAGYGNFQNNQAQQQNLAGALQGIANGQGPNPAQAMLNQATGNNVANQAALIAGQRGAGANAGMMARQAAQAGAGVQQQAAGQAATLQAQQSLGALGQQGQILGQMGSQNIGEQGMNAGLFGSAAGAQNTQNSNTIQNYNNMQTLNQQTAQHNADAVNKTQGGLMNGLGGVLGMAGTVFGGPLGGMAGDALGSAMSGGSTGSSVGGGLGSMVGGAIGMASGGQVPDHIKHVQALYHPDPEPIATNTATSTNTATTVQDRTRDSMREEFSGLATESFADGGAVAQDFKGVQGKIGNWATEGKSSKQLDADKYNADPRNASTTTELPQDVKGMAVSDFRSGGRVGGNAKVAGDSLKNDNQPAMLSPKEIVLPRSITMAPDAPEKAAEFVAALLKKQGHGNSNHHKEFHKALKDAILSRKKKSGA